MCRHEEHSDEANESVLCEASGSGLFGRRRAGDDDHRGDQHAQDKGRRVIVDGSTRMDWRARRCSISTIMWCVAVGSSSVLCMVIMGWRWCVVGTVEQGWVDDGVAVEPVLRLNVATVIVVVVCHA